VLGLLPVDVLLVMSLGELVAIEVRASPPANEVDLK
jgi:hypothetical protein